MNRHHIVSARVIALAATVLSAGALAGCGLLHRHRGNPPFWVVDLAPLPGGKTSQVFDLNDAGVAVGRADFGGSHGHQHAVVWEEDKAPRDLGSLDPRGGSEADKISPGGAIVGWTSVEGVHVEACQFSGGREPGPQLCFRHAGTMSLTFAVADDGTVGVTWDQPSGEIHSALTGDVALDDIGALPGYRDTTATAMSIEGIVVGTSDNGTVRKQAFEWSNKVFRALPVPAGYTDSFANAVSTKGDIAGSCSIGPSHFVAVVWRNGQPSVLATPKGKDSEAYGLDDAGDVVGECNNHACLWRKGHLIDLNASTGNHAKTVLNTAIAINRAGVIACNGLVNKQIHGFLLMPNKDRS